ncbi:MAG: AI-2E family transporter [Bacteroidetes bacterium]|nr:AI-2E family transporter [Bacteroidota bacterium]
MNRTFNDRLRQVLLLAIIILIASVLIAELYVFLPGLLGGITLYILSREMYFRLVEGKKWKRGGTALLFILAFVVIISGPIYLSIRLASPSINELLNNQQSIVNNLQTFSEKVKDNVGIELLSEENIKALGEKITVVIPQLLNSTAGVLANLLIMLFLLYYLLTSGRQVEKYLTRIIPLENKNIHLLAKETKSMIKANALGIPIISIIQGITAAFGYWIFGVSDWAMWGFITGVFAFFPIVGTMIIWIPIVISLYTKGMNWPATGLGLYSLIITGNIDYVARMSLLKKLGDVHPMVTVLGVIVGLSLFGFMGLIFGPLLISYFLILVKIYLNEFTSFDDNKPVASNATVK